MGFCINCSYKVTESQSLFVPHVDQVFPRYRYPDSFLIVSNQGSSTSGFFDTRLSDY